jgi:hypothetical protein
LPAPCVQEEACRVNNKTEKGTNRFFTQTGLFINPLPYCLWVLYSRHVIFCTPAKKHKKFLIEIFPYRSRLIRAWTFMRSMPKAGQEDIPVCYEKWSEGEQVNKTLEKARKEADQMIEKAKSAPRPEPEKETRRETEPEAA